MISDSAPQFRVNRRLSWVYWAFLISPQTSFWVDHGIRIRLNDYHLLFYIFIVASIDSLSLCEMRIGCAGCQVSTATWRRCLHVKAFHRHRNMINTSNGSLVAMKKPADRFAVVELQRNDVVHILIVRFEEVVPHSIIQSVSHFNLSLRIEWSRQTVERLEETKRRGAEYENKMVKNLRLSAQRN